MGASVTPVCNLCGGLLSVPVFSRNEQVWEKQQPAAKHEKINHVPGPPTCSTCESTFVERSLKRTLDELTAVQAPNTRLRVLHYSPTPKELSLVASLNPEIHVLANISATDTRYEKVNIESPPYSRESFDLIIANNDLMTVPFPISSTLKNAGLLKAGGTIVFRLPSDKYLEDRELCAEPSKEEESRPADNYSFKHVLYTKSTLKIILHALKPNNLESVKLKQFFLGHKHFKALIVKEAPVLALQKNS